MKNFLHKVTYMNRGDEMILSASKNTDLLNFYPEWLYNRLESGSFCKNDNENNKIFQYKFTPDTIECVVFWTKNAIPFMKYLPKIDKLGYKYYFQYTITPYKNDVEMNIGNKRDILNNFKELSKKIGPEKMVWRYDPIIINQSFDFEYHKKAFSQLCKSLKGYTNECVVSSVKENPYSTSDMYIRNLYSNEIDSFKIFCTLEGMKNNIAVRFCNEKYESKVVTVLDETVNACISKEKIEKIANCKIKVKKEKNASKYCNCITNIDMGTKETCIGQCKYCVSGGEKIAKCSKNFKNHNSSSELLIGNLKINDKIKKIILPSLKIEEEKNLFGIA